MAGMNKNRKTADGFQNFLLGLQFLIKFDKTAKFRGNRQKMPEIHMWRNSGRYAAGVSLFPVSCTCWEMPPLGLHFNLGISQSGSATL
jgi:hypothetical protein